MDPQLALILHLTDKAFTIMQHINEVKAMSKEQVLAEIEKEGLEINSLLKEVTLG